MYKLLAQLVNTTSEAKCGGPGNLSQDDSVFKTILNYLRASTVLMKDCHQK